MYIISAIDDHWLTQGVNHSVWQVISDIRMGDYRSFPAWREQYIWACPQNIKDTFVKSLMSARSMDANICNKFIFYGDSEIASIGFVVKQTVETILMIAFLFAERVEYRLQSDASRFAISMALNEVFDAQSLILPSP